MFFIKKNQKPFSRLPVDLILEQIINADAASQRTGINVVTNSISARQRWPESHCIRLSIISHLFAELNFTKKEDISRDLKPNTIKKYGEHLETIILTTIKTMNPFSLDFNKEALFNIGSGKAATSFLLH